MRILRSNAFLLLLIVMLIPAFLNSIKLTDQVIPPYPEITELEYDIYDMRGWKPAPNSMTPKGEIAVLLLESRHNFIPDRDYLTNRFLITSIQESKAIVPNLHMIYYQKLRKHYSPENLGQAGLFFDSKGLFHQVVFGNFALCAGEGLCLNSYSKSSYTGLIYPAFTLSHPVMSGAAVQLKYHNLESAIWLSQTERLATMDGDKIVKLYESLISDLKDKDKIQEQTNGIITTYNSREYNLGCHYYHQDYSKEFADSTFSPVSDVFGLWGILRHKCLTLSAETDLMEDKAAFGGSLKMGRWSWEQTLRYIYRPDTGPLSFAQTKQIFGQKTGAQEISWDARYKPVNSLTLTSRIAAFNDLSDNADSRWKERLIFGADWIDSDRSARLTWYRFQKDAVAAYDSLGTEILPTQNRFRAQWNQHIFSGLSVSTVLQYQHYLDQSFSKNGFSLQQSVDYKVVKAHVKLSFLGWVNQKSSYVPSEYLADEELLLQGGSDSALRLKANYRIGKLIDLGLGTYFPFKKTESRSFSLNLRTAF